MARGKNKMRTMNVALLAGLVAGSLVLNGDRSVVAQDAKKTPGTTTTTDTGESAVDKEHVADEDAIRMNGAAFTKAYASGDAKALAEHFATDAEYVHDSNVTCRGRTAIQESLTEFFKANPGCKLVKEIDSIRFVSPGVAIEDGSTSCTCADESSCVECRYTTVHVRTDGKWLVASVHDRDAHDLKEHSLKLEQLAWLQGDWVDEGHEAVVHFACEPVDNGNFLVRSFSIQIAGHESMRGTQRIGWDPLSGKLRTWIFDSSGSFGEGTWYRESVQFITTEDDTETPTDEQATSNTSERWILKISGVMADGKAASSTSVYTVINDHTVNWQCVDHEIAGVHQPDSDVVTIVRKAPAPATSAAAEQR